MSTVRDLLLALGMGDFNATLTIRYAFMAVSTTDPSMPPIILLVKHIQQNLIDMGASGITVNGRLDNPTAAALEQISGSQFLSQPWWQIVTDVLKSKAAGFTFAPPSAIYGGNTPTPTGSGGSLAGALDSVPGGAMGVAVGAAALWYLFFKRSA